jgi:hypothetical protein
MWSWLLSDQLSWYSGSLSETDVGGVETRRGKTSEAVKQLERKVAVPWGRLVLINAVLTNMVLCMISFFHLPKGILNGLDYLCSRFFWKGDSEKKKYWLTKWSVVCHPKDQRRLGVHYLEVKNMNLLGKWLTRLLLRMVYGNNY